MGSVSYTHLDVYKRQVYMQKETGVTFADVAGQDEAKESLVELIIK